MKFEGVSFAVTDWNKLSSVGTRGESGKAVSKEFNQGMVRVRLVEYSADYKSDHWCDKGHIVVVLEGELVVDFEDGKRYEVREGMNIQIGDEAVPHKVSTRSGAKVIIFD